MRPAALLPLTAAALLTAAPALAEPPPTRLEYLPGPGTESCPNAEGFRHVVASHMGGTDPFTDKAAHRLTVRITYEDDSFDGLITTHDANGHQIGDRLIADHASCSTLAHALATTIALILPKRRPSSASPQRSTTDAPEPRALPGAPAPDSTTPEPAPTPASIRPQLAAGALVPFGTTPSPTVGLTAAFGFRWRFISLNLEGRADLPRSTDDADTRVQAASSTFTGALVPCAHVWWILGCGIIGAGATRITAEDNAIPASEWGARGEIGARLGLQVPVYGPFSAQISSDILFPFARHGISVAGRSMWEPSTVAILPGLRLIVTL